MLNQKLTGQQAADKTYIEDVFSTYLYTGNGSTQTINNGIDLAGKGGLVWIKARENPGNDAYGHVFYDTNRGIQKALCSNGSYGTSNELDFSGGVTGKDLYSFNSNGFSLGTDSTFYKNQSTVNHASWTFRKAPKFFDVVTWTGDGTSSRSIPHSLGSVPGMIIVKCRSTTSNWTVYHRSASENLYLNTTDSGTGGLFYISGNSTSTNIVLGTNTTGVNSSGVTYVAYLFAHDTTTDGLIQCGSYTGNGSTQNITLGWEPQFLLIKNATAGSNWLLLDVMRGMPVATESKVLYPNTADAEATWPTISLTATGFILRNADSWYNGSGSTYIYMAIRRGPMKTPTDGTKVFSPSFATSGAPWFKSGFPVDAAISGSRSITDKFWIGDRFRGENVLWTNITAAESPIGGTVFSYQNGWNSNSTATTDYISYMFRRAPGFFDVVCYTGTGAASTTVTHNLGVAPEMIIVKARAGASDNNWYVYQKDILTTDANGILSLNRTLASTSFSGEYVFGNNTNIVQPTSTLFTVGAGVNDSGQTSVGYLFASCPGVSKVGSYTGNGSSQTINCGFAAGARFVLIKRTDNTGDWYVWDTARGIVTGNDPHLSLNTTAAEVTSDDTIDPDSNGFIVNQVAATNVNVSGASYIYLAIA